VARRLFKDAGESLKPDRFIGYQANMDWLMIAIQQHLAPPPFSRRAGPGAVNRSLLPSLQHAILCRSSKQARRGRCNSSISGKYIPLLLPALTLAITKADLAGFIGAEKQNLAQPFVGVNPGLRRSGLRDLEGRESLPFRLQWRPVHNDSATRIGRLPTQIVSTSWGYEGIQLITSL